MAEKKLQEAIEDLKFMANKQTEPLQRIAFNIAITICEQHLPKELDGEKHLKQMINTYEKAGHKIGVVSNELDKEAQSLIDKFATEVGSSDFHVPEFISGVPMADGSEGYKKVYKDEETSLAKQCAIIHCDLMIKEMERTDETRLRLTHYTTLKQKIEAL